MTSLSITPKFNTKNLLEILIKNNSDQIFSSFKVCFSLVYSIKSVEGARILRQTGRYYELKTDDSNLPAHMDPSSLYLHYKYQELAHIICLADLKAYLS